MKTTGFDMAASVTPGTTVERVYFAVPVHGTTGSASDTIEDALRAAIARAEEIAAQHALPNGKGFTPRVTIDVRWILRYPKGPTGILGGSRDCVAERYSYENAADAQAHLDRLIKFATT